MNPLSERIATESLDCDRWDVVVVGAGPAGAIAARELARRGLRVLLVDKRVFPRDKVCGCCLNGRVLRLLQLCGLGDLPSRLDAAPIGVFRLSGNRRTAELPLPLGFALSRSRLDDALAAAAADAGARFEFGVAATIVETRGGTATVALRGAQRDAMVQTRVVICATGLGGAASVGGPGRPSEWVASPARMGAAQIVDAATDAYQAGVIHMAVAERGYVGSVRLEDGRLNVAAALDESRVRQIGIHRTVEEIVNSSGAEWIDGLAADSWHGTQPLTRRLPTPAWERTFAIGDAAGYIQPFTGEGIAWGIQSALAVVPFAVAACRNWQPSMADDWRHAHRRLVRSRQHLCRLLSWSLGRPPIFKAMMWALASWPGFAAPFVKRMNQQKLTSRETAE